MNSPGHGTSHTRKSVFELFLELERKHALWEKKTSWGVYYWKIIRFSLYESVLRQLGLTENRKRDGGRPKPRKTAILLESLNSVLLCLRKVDAIIFEYPRKVKKEGIFVDPYTGPLAEELRREGTSFVLVDEGQPLHLNPSLKRRRYVGRSVFEGVIRRRIRRMGEPLDAASEEKLKAILEELSLALGVTIQYDKTRSRLRSFELQRRVWRRILNRTGCRDLYLVCSYGLEGIIAAAQDAGVRVTELQHGLILKYHPGYSFGRRSIPYFPSRLFVFGKKWCGSFLPLGPDECRVTGHRFLNEYRKQVSDDPNKREIVFLSQWSVNEKLLKFARSLHGARPELEITYKFHPLESDAAVERARNTIPGVKFVRAEQNVYEILSEARIAVGVYSTSIFEALALGCRIVLVNAPGIEVLEDLVTDLELPVLSSTREFERLLSSMDLSVTAKRIDEWFHGCRG